MAAASKTRLADRHHRNRDFTGNRAHFGAGIANESGGETSIDSSIFTTNTATTNGGGIDDLAR